MTQFEIGDIVRCIDATGLAEDVFVKDGEYTVSNAYGEYVTIGSSESAWNANRFTLSELAPPNASSGLSADPKKAHAVQKAPLHLNPPAGAILQSYAQLNGATKYGPFNWRKSEEVELMTYLGAIMRHVACIIDGEDAEVDPKTGIKVDHLGAIMASAAIVADARSIGKLIDNRPPKGAAAEMFRAHTYKSGES
jgi:hypothetical protein